MKLRSKHKIISITVTHAHILLNTGETTKVALNELSFKPKVNDIVEVYQNKDQIIVMKVREKRKQWIYTDSDNCSSCDRRYKSLVSQSQGRLH